MQGDVINISTRIEWYNGNFDDIVNTNASGLDPIVLPLTISALEGEIVTAAELVEQLNKNMNDYLLEKYVETGLNM